MHGLRCNVVKVAVMDVLEVRDIDEIKIVAVGGNVFLQRKQ